VVELEGVVAELKVAVARVGGEVVPEVVERQREAGEELAVEVTLTGDGRR